MRTTHSLVLALAVSSIPSLAFARDHHVAPEGDDAGPGTAERPLKTLQRAADAAVPGDVVLVHAGTYSGFVVESVNATADRPLVFRADPGVRIDRPGPLPAHAPLNTATDTYVWAKWPHAVTIQRSSHVVLEGFEIVGMPVAEYDAGGHLLHKGGSGVYAGASRHLVFRKNHVHDNGRWGIFTAFCDDTTVEDNVVSGSAIEHGVYLSNSADRAIVRRNVLFGNELAGVQINADNTFDDDDYRKFADPDGISTDNVLEDNAIFDNGRGGAAGINLDGVSDSIVRRNVLTGNHATGIALGQLDGRTGSQRNRITDNVIAMAGDARWGIMWLGCQPDVIDPRGHCTSADVPRLPEWTRPPALASGSTGNVLTNNVVMTASVVSGSLYTDHASLAPDAVSGARTFGDFESVADRFGIGSDTIAYTPTVLDAAGWRAATGLDRHSIVLPAPH